MADICLLAGCSGKSCFMNLVAFLRRSTFFFFFLNWDLYNRFSVAEERLGEDGG